jgi:hypothetical protein
MATSTDPRRLLGRALAIFGLDGGNARALANARKILDGLQAAREQVDALELRAGQRAPLGLGVAWPVPPGGSVATPGGGPGGVEPPSNQRPDFRGLGCVNHCVRRRT